MFWLGKYRNFVGTFNGTFVKWYICASSSDFKLLKLMTKYLEKMMIAKTPKPPYYAVIFTSIRTKGDHGYNEMAERMVELAQKQEGFLGIESAREQIGITVSYWRDLASIAKWKAHTEHQLAQKKGKTDWYNSFCVRIALVEREYGV